MKVDTYMLANEICTGEIFVNIEETDILYIYDRPTGCFINNGKVFVRKYLENRYGSDISTHFTNETAAHIQNRSMKRLEEFGELNALRYDKNDPEDILINLKNGVFSAKKQVLLEHDPNYMFTTSLPFDYDKDAECPETLKFLKTITKPNYDRFFMLLETAAWVLMPSNKYQKMVLFWGEGENGKGTYLRLLTALIGKTNTCTASIEQLINNRFMPAQLFGKMLNAAGDIPTKPLYDTGVIKRLSGEDLTTTEKKNGQPFQFLCNAKNFFSANKFPKTTDDTRAFYRRWTIVLFGNRFSAEDGTRVENLSLKLTSEKELAGFFNLLVGHILPILMNRSGFTYDRTVDQIEDLYNRLSDSVKIFLEECVIADVLGEIDKDDLRTAYEGFCEEQKLLKETDKAFRNTLNNSGILFEEHKRQGKRYYKGIRLKQREIKETTQNQLILQNNNKKTQTLEETLKEYVERQDNVNNIANISASLLKQMNKEGVAKKPGNVVNPIPLDPEIPQNMQKDSKNAPNVPESIIMEDKGAVDPIPRGVDTCQDCGLKKPTFYYVSGLEGARNSKLICQDCITKKSESDLK